MTDLAPNSARSSTVYSPSAFEFIPIALKELRRTFGSGTTRSAAWRLRQLRAVERLCSQEESAISRALALDLGRPDLDAYVAEISFVRNEASHARKHLKQWMADSPVHTPLTLQPASSTIQQEPLGTVLVISPWNYPFQLLMAPMVAALAAGNTVVLKPSEVARHTAELIADLIPRYLDPTAVKVIQGGVPETTALLEQRFDHIFYTGNSTVGRIVMRAAAEHLTPVTLELGGKSPCIVSHDANLKLAAKRIAFGKFFNAGQTCVAPDYVMVEESVVGRFIAHLVDAVRSFYGEHPEASADYARIVNSRHHDRLVQLIEGSGTIALGGDHDRASGYIAPTILRDVPLDSPIMRDEIFGPLLPVVTVATLSAAIDHINAGPKPLAAYVFTESDDIANRVLRETSSGGACVNHCVMHLLVPELPFGGVGESGMGAYHGKWGFDTFSHRKSVFRAATKVDSTALLYPPMDGIREAIVRKVL